MPDNAPRLWTVNFILACIANFMLGFSFYLTMPVLPFYLLEHLQIDKGTVGLIMSCYVAAALMVRPFSGFFVDRYPSKPLYLISLSVFTFLSAGYLVADSVFVFVALRLGIGLSFGIITTASNTQAIDIMPAARRGEGIGYFGLMTNLSMALGPMAGLFLFEQYSFSIMFESAIAVGLLGIIFASFIKPPVKLRVSHLKISLDRFILTKAIPIGLNIAFFAMSYGMISSFAAMYGKEIGVVSTGLFFTFMAAGMISSRLFAGKMIDRGQIRLITTIGLALLSAGFGLFAFANDSITYFAAASIIGIGFGIVNPSFQSMIIDVGAHNQRGTANATYFTTYDFSIGIGMIAAGKIAEMSNLSTAYGFCAIMCVLALFVFLRIMAPYYERKKHE